MDIRGENPALNHLRNAIAETSAEDEALAREVSELLSKLEVSPQTVANSVKENLHKVSKVLRSEGLPEADETALILSMDEKRVRDKQQRMMNRDLRNKYKELLDRHSLLERRLNYLKENIGLIRDSVAENKIEYKNEYSSDKLLANKLTEYNTTADTMETDIESLNIKELEPEKIEEKFNRFMERKGQLSEINQALIPYSNLPPNLLQAKALLESKELEYNELTQRVLSLT